MPELPEVETVVRRLRSVLPGKEVSAIKVYKQKSFMGDIYELIGTRITQVNRKAKLIHIELKSGKNVLVHLKMTGQLIYVDESVRLGGGHPTADWLQALPSTHTRVSITFSDGSNLYFNDQRIFGWIRLLSPSELENEFARYAPDVIEESISDEYFWDRVQRTSRAIKVVILDSKIMSGLGNIYACDALNIAQISPYRKANTLSKSEADRLLDASKAVLQKGIELGGATIEHFRHIDGFSGNYQKEVAVYGREGEPCLNCGGTIIKEKIAGRGTYFCPNCQI
ncbi:MAG: bifunctional DNA-formamidopyrimidine glycosylase/DNA-(apurinic or apyrimidinic site) lyase [Pseudomonadales bacterium]|nr:bifunctional DNA-formamidopyrimidine glycosylase/DNA-(apurinic or apyrimidinic site) lyase [Candidatus Woesebacteria bacterium]MCB9800709.1 bifunctional DNA-formamidopyrimidine glycosylase/DNA-(apurinic or apyrimidinic site) lyase [Pseudomonadales bacterium]